MEVIPTHDEVGMEDRREGGRGEGGVNKAMGFVVMVGSWDKVVIEYNLKP